MFGIIPLWAVSLIIQILQKTGLVNWAAALTVKSIVAAEKHIENLKTYPSYPSQNSKGQANFN